MNSSVTWWKWGFSAIVLVMALWWGDALAASSNSSIPSVPDAGSTSWFTRAIWDELMRWVNFFILAGIIVKYGRTPMADFLKGKKTETARILRRLEDKKREAEEKIKDGQAQLEDSNARLERIKERIVEEGQKYKTKLIADAQKQSSMMLDAAQDRIDNQIRDAYQIIKVELIEAATDKALAKLPAMMTEQDHLRMVGLWMEEAGR